MKIADIKLRSLPHDDPSDDDDPSFHRITHGDIDLSFRRYRRVVDSPYIFYAINVKTSKKLGRL